MAVVLPGIWPSEGSVFPLTTPPGSDQQTPWCHHKVSLLSLHTPRETPQNSATPQTQGNPCSHTQELQQKPRAEQPEPDLSPEQLLSLISTARATLLKAVQLTQQAPKTPPRAGPAAKPQPVPFGRNFSELLNIQKRDWPLLGPSLRNSWPSPLPHLPQVTWRSKGRGWQRSGLKENKPGDGFLNFFWLHPKGSGM